MIKRNIKGQFVKGGVPWNKGLLMCSTQWNGGETANKQGRIMVIVGYKDDGKAIYRQRSRLVVESALGRPLERYELVHHIDEDKSNDNLDNLQVVSWMEHNHIHSNWLHKEKD